MRASGHFMYSMLEMSDMNSRKWLACRRKIVKLLSAWRSGVCAEKWLVYDGCRLHERMYAIVTSTVDETRLNGLNMEAITLPRPPFFILHNLGVVFGSIQRISSIEFTWNAPWYARHPLHKTFGCWKSGGGRGRKFYTIIIMLKLLLACYSSEL